MKFLRYSLTDGSIIERIDGPDGWTPMEVDGTGLVEGHADPVRHRIDLDTKQPVPYTPPDPQDGSVWNEAQHRWVPLEEQNFTRRLLIEDAERKQHRALRELVLELAKKAAGVDPQAVSRVQEIDDLVVQERNRLKKKEPRGG